MKVLLTGGAGYIGSHIVKLLLTKGHQIMVVDNLQKGHQQALKGGKFYQIDLADRKKLELVFQEEQIEGVIHLAADSLVGESMEHPAKYYYNNVLNGYNLLEVMRKYEVNYLVFSSTAAVYGEPIELPLTETTPTKPTNVYGRSKLHFEEMLADYSQAYGLKFISLRYFNAAGADFSGQIGEDHQPETHLIPIVLQKALGQRERLCIFGTDYPTPDGTCIRDYIHVNDLALAHLLALEALAQGQGSNIYNLGNGEGYSVREVIDTASQVVGKEILAVEAGRRLGDPAVLVASSKKIQRELNWSAASPGLKTIIETAWKWHKYHPTGYS